jgi:hypothetical protein
MARYCPHCRTKVGVLAKACWKCRYPLDLGDSESERIFLKEKKRARKIGAMTVLLLIFLVILAIAGIFAVFAGGDYLILFLLFLCLLPFLILLRKARKAERILKAYEMDPWHGEGWLVYPWGLLMLWNIFTAQRMPEWKVSKWELAAEAVVIGFLLSMLAMLIIAFQDAARDSDYGPYGYIISLVAFFIFIGLFVMTYIRDVNIFRAQRRWA